MSSVFCRPLPFTAASGAPAPAGGSIANLSNDHPALGWSFGLTSPALIIDLGTEALSYDYVALFGSNLRASDTVQIRTGTTATGTGSYAGTALPAYSGAKDPNTTTTSIYRLSSTRTERFLRIDLSAAGHPAGAVQFTRLVVGKAVTGDGIDLGAENSFEGQSIISTGAGWRTVDDYGSLDAWKVSTGWIKDTDWRATWAPMLRYAARGFGLMFIADDSAPATWQTDALFGFMSGTAIGKWDASNSVRFETKLVAYSR